MNLRNAAEDRQCIRHSRIQQIGDRKALVLNRQRFAVVSFAAADFAIDTYTFGRKLISIFRSPSPWHASHRPPFTLKLNRPALYPRARDSGSMA